MALTATQIGLARIAHRLERSNDLNRLLAEIGEAKYVLIGEASHGTSDFYAWRAALSRRLIREKNFNFVAVEGDWPPCYEVNRYVKNYFYTETPAEEVLNVFERWPSWMWANKEVARFITWLKDHNLNLPKDKRAGFYGLDVYSLWESLENVLDYLTIKYPELLPEVSKIFRCFEPYVGNEYGYARASAIMPKSCEDEVIGLLVKLQKRHREAPHVADAEEKFNAEQNARVAVNAERYYRATMLGSDESWNVRDSHMVKTLYEIASRYGEKAKGIVWAHNTHVGDARYTDMGSAGMVNVGQLVREQSSRENVFIVGFGTYEGTVIAGKYWDAPQEIMPVPRAIPSSWEADLHHYIGEDALLLSHELKDVEGSHRPRGHRAVGVVYSPEQERGNYVPSVLPDRYDSFMHIERSSALHPIHPEHPPAGELPDTFPFAF
ncbi:MAG: Erythromycin esterase [Candidatus Saccharibacteria bacterium]|nr:Erythromycin esterase [Candidatus Saccharibacteria bacterium]